MRKAIVILLILVFGFHNQAYCRDINAAKSLENTKIAWESIFSNKKCVLLQKRYNGYETYVYRMKHFEYDIVKTDSRTNPYKLTVRIDVESWSSSQRKTSIKDAITNLEESGDRLQGSGTANFPLTALYKLEDGRWVLSTGNKWMLDFLKRARARYNTHVNLSRIISIPQNP